MERFRRDVVVSGTYALLSGAVLWPPGAVYWTGLATVGGEYVTLSVVLLAAVGLGAGFARLTRVDPGRFLAGGIAAYVLGMGIIEVVSAPDSPVHLVWYGGVLACLVGGVILGRQAAIGGRASAPVDG